jgi:polyhydroxyalkanoate synthesis repressor PhaR
MAKSASDKVTIKKYANRRLYDTESSSYITLDRLAAMIREGRDFEVLDAKSGEDITHQVLTQIIVDEESRGTTMLPANFLRQLIGMYGGQSQSMVPPFLESAMDAFKKNQETVAGAFSRHVRRPRQAQHGAVRRRRAGVHGKKPAKPANPASGDNRASEIAKLKAELAALQAKVDKLG